MEYKRDLATPLAPSEACGPGDRGKKKCGNKRIKSGGKYRSPKKRARQARRRQLWSIKEIQQHHWSLRYLINIKLWEKHQ